LCVYSDDQATPYSWYEPKAIGKEPESMDYRVKKAFNPIQRQYPCGSSWAFSAVSSIESHIFLKTNEQVKLSEQYLIDCSKGFGFPNETGHTGCGPGWKSGAMEYVIKNGIAYADTYPYNGTVGTCNQDAQKTPHRVKEIKEVTNGSDTELLNALLHLGPVAVSIFTSENFGNYTGGIFEDELCHDANETNLAVVLVGYGKEDGESGKKYWIIRNSYGDNWGEKGYMKLSRDINNHCLISSIAFIPIIELAE
ncbi:unnamed protein product, partial [Meganyctiphanes norvegica]